METTLYSLTFRGATEQRHDAMRALEKTVYGEDGETRYLNAFGLAPHVYGFNRLLFDDRDEMTIACVGPYPAQELNHFLEQYPGLTCSAEQQLSGELDLDAPAVTSSDRLGM
jgi:hypothetical protein